MANYQVAGQVLGAAGAVYGGFSGPSGGVASDAQYAQNNWLAE
jgi:hypothetical protein